MELGETRRDAEKQPERRGEKKKAAEDFLGLKGVDVSGD